jgi:hypothetical protein
MTGLLEPKRALAVAFLVTACSTYEPSLLQSTFTGGAAGAGQGGSAGAAAGSTGAAAGSAGDAPVGGNVGGDMPSSGAAGAAGSAEGGDRAIETSPYVSGTILAPFINAGLTLQGTLDWAHWGLTAAGDYNHKAAVVSQLMDFKPTGSVAPTRFLDGPTTFVWSDGMPTKSATTNDGIKWQGVGEGFQLAVSAGQDVRKLQLYVGVYAGTGALTASLSDPQSVGKGDDRFTSEKATWALQIVTLEYGNTDQPGATLNVSWRVETATAPDAAVCLTAIAVSPN